MADLLLLIGGVVLEIFTAIIAIELLDGKLNNDGKIKFARDYAIIPMHICAFILIGAGVLR